MRRPPVSVRPRRREHRTRLRPTRRGLIVLAVLTLLLIGLLILGALGLRALFSGSGSAVDRTAEHTKAVAAGPANTTQMVKAKRLTGKIRPKSVVAGPDGTVIANNMIYEHTATLYDGATMAETATISDVVDLSDFGYPAARAGETHGAPVEAAYSRDGKHIYVTQYGLTGPGSGKPSTDKCVGGDAIGRSAIFRLNLETRAWDQVIEVGRVPKFLSISADGKLALVSNWCDSTVSVVDLAQGKEVRSIPVDSAPRGSVILADNRTAYVTAMYADELYRVDMVKGTSELVMKTGRRPRHLVLSPDGKRLYMTESGADRLRALDPATGEVIDETTTGREPRSMAISEDGTALYVVNYHENTVSKFDAATLKELQREKVGANPVGVAREALSGRVWVANYGGSIDVFDDTAAREKTEGAADG